MSESLREFRDMQVRRHLDPNNIFFAKQHGFRQIYSTETTLSKLVGNLVELCNKTHKAITVFIDIRKAFDGVEHIILYI